MVFNDICERLKNRVWAPMDDGDAIDMIIDAYCNEEIDEDEKEMLLDLV